MIIQTWHCDHMRISRGDLIRMNRQMDDKGKRAIWKSPFFLFSSSFSLSFHLSHFLRGCSDFRKTLSCDTGGSNSLLRAFGIRDCETVNPVRVFLPSTLGHSPVLK